jgi:hypothetical protein
VVDSFIASENTALTLAFAATPVAALAGLVLVTTGTTGAAPVAVTTLPPESNATQSEVDGHETPPLSEAGESIGPGALHAPAPPVGFVEVTTFPWASTATHSDVDEQETL